MNSVLYINKPSGISSFDICYKLRKILNTKRIGHTGTLDPNATGVMVILYNEATKAAQFLVSDTKQYKTRVLFGIETDTLDIDGNIVNSKPYTVPNRDEIERVLDSFKGKSKQEVPITSAKKINGKKLYEYQLEGKKVELPIIDINVFEISLDEIYEDGFSFTCTVSSGTYIRALVRDMLVKLNLIGTVKDLQRTKIDNISIEQCDDLEDVLRGNYSNHDLLEILGSRYKKFEVNNVEDIKNGKRISIDSNEDLIVITHNNELIAMYKKDGDYYSNARGLW